MKSTTRSTMFVQVIACCFAAGSAAQAAGIAGQGSWETTLLGRDANLQPVAATSVQAVYLYDTVLDVTWLRTVPAAPFVGWTEAFDWADSLVTGVGTAAVSDWRLPGMLVANPASIATLAYDGSSPQGYNAALASSEMASLFYGTLGNVAKYGVDGSLRASGYGLANTGSFLGMASYPYWMDTSRGFILAGRDVKWTFDTRDGLQWYSVEEATINAMAVRAGDVMAAVPEPRSALMLALGLTLLLPAVASRSLRPLR